ncbi:sensor histidine kinase, partial [Halorubrum pallidum]
DATLAIETDASVRGDESRLRQLFENLFRNGVEHGTPSGRTRSDDAVEHDAAGGGDGDGSPLTIAVGELDDGSGFYVEDDGIGIPADRRESVFESGYTTDTDGTGFGLTIAREVVEAHGWEIEVTAGNTGGARFEITGVSFE